VCYYVTVTRAQQVVRTLVVEYAWWSKSAAAAAGTRGRLSELECGLLSLRVLRRGVSTGTVLRGRTGVGMPTRLLV